jgi:hypothetical protein
VALGPQRRRRGVGNLWERQVAGTAGRHQVLRGGNRLPLGDQESVGRDAQRGVMVEAAPPAAFEMSEPDLLLELLIIALDTPAHFGDVVELWGREPTRGVEQHCGSVKLWLPNGTLLPHAQSPIVEVLRTGIPALNVEVFIERPDGSRLPVLVIFTALRNAQGEITGAVTSFMDITERKEAERRQHFLMNELAHRSNNLLAVIQSIASRSLSGTRPLAEAREVLTQRIQALARSQSVLMTEGLDGAPVAEIIRLEFEAFSERINAVGHDVMLNPRAAQTFALVVHELATNAAKHCALSRLKLAASRISETSPPLSRR